MFEGLRRVNLSIPPVETLAYALLPDRPILIWSLLATVFVLFAVEKSVPAVMPGRALNQNDIVAELGSKGLIDFSTTAPVLLTSNAFPYLPEVHVYEPKSARLSLFVLKSATATPVPSSKFQIPCGFMDTFSAEFKE